MMLIFFTPLNCCLFIRSHHFFVLHFTFHLLSIRRPGLINVDFADVRTIMGDAGTALMGIGRGSGENKIDKRIVSGLDDIMHRMDKCSRSRSSETPP